MIRAFNGKTPRIAPSAFVSEAAYVVGDVEIGEDSTIWPGVVIRADVQGIRIGRNVHIEDGSILHAVQTPLIIGDDVVIGHGVVLHCHEIAGNVLVANNATVLEGVKIGRYCVIAAGSLVRPRTVIPEGSFVEGNPAEVKGDIRENQRERILGGARLHRELAKQFRAAGLEANKEGFLKT